MDIKDIRIQGLKESIVRIRQANNAGSRTLVDSLCMVAADQIRSLELTSNPRQPDAGKEEVK